MPRKYTPEETRAAFFSRVVVNEQPHPRLGTPCHEWTGSRSPGGYGAASGRRKAHRVAWAYAHNEDPGKGCVLHRCDNPPCVNPEHLYLGDQKQNAADREARGRSNYTRAPSGDRHWSRRNPEKVARGERSGPSRHPETLPHGDDHWSRQRPEKVLRGEQNGAVKLTEVQVIQIRELVAAGAEHRKVAALFNVSRSLVYLIATRRRWAHVA